MALNPSKSTRVYVQKGEDIPLVEHYAIIENSSVHVPDVGVWAPGHGYPAHDEGFITYEAFTDKEEFLVELGRKVKSAARYSSRVIRAIHVTPLVINTNVTVEVE